MPSLHKEVENTRTRRTKNKHLINLNKRGKGTCGQQHKKTEREDGDDMASDIANH